VITALDIDDLARRATTALAARFPGCALSDVAPLGGGSSSLTYGATVTGLGRRVVVRVAPPGLAPVRNRDVIRQARIMKVLESARGVAVPEILASDDGDPPFFIMSFTSGESYEPLLSESPSAAPDRDIAERAWAAVEMLGALHAVPRTDPRMEKEPSTELETELARWARAFETVDDDLRAGAGECHERLIATIPPARTPAILHGDWRLGNMLCEGPAINGVIDWEIWSVGDPRLDLAWFLLMADRRHPRCIRPDAALPPVSELQDAYERASGAPARDMSWFAALVRYKQAAASALIAKNARKRDPSASVSTAVPQMLRWALEFLD
jgi:aminoglycoside phosphotransferase (APT) family kinase protein